MNNIKYNSYFWHNRKETQTQEFSEICPLTSNSKKINILKNNEKVINLSIQAQPGLKLYINDGEYPIIVNSNGIFQWQINQPNVYIGKIEINRDEQINPQSNIIISYEYYE